MRQEEMLCGGTRDLLDYDASEAQNRPVIVTETCEKWEATKVDSRYKMICNRSNLPLTVVTSLEGIEPTPILLSKQSRSEPGIVVLKRIFKTIIEAPDKSCYFINPTWWYRQPDYIQEQHLNAATGVDFVLIDRLDCKGGTPEARTALFEFIGTVVAFGTPALITYNDDATFETNMELQVIKEVDKWPEL